MVTVRSSSTRLPRKCFRKLSGDLSQIQIVLRRAKKIGCRVVLTTTEDPSDDALEEIAREERVECFRGAVHNKIRRWADCMSRFGGRVALLVDGDDPTFDYAVGRRALGLLCSGAELVVSSPELTPGFFTYGINKSGMRKLLWQAPDSQTDTDVITEFVARAGLRKTEVSATPEESLGHDLRLTVDYPEDVEFYRAVFERVDYLAPGPEVVRVAQRHGLQSINWHRHSEFLSNQSAFNERVKKDHG